MGPTRPTKEQRYTKKKMLRSKPRLSNQPNVPVCSPKLLLRRSFRNAKRLVRIVGRTIAGGQNS